MRAIVAADELEQLRREAQAGRAFIELCLARRTAGRVNVPARELDLAREVLGLAPPIEARPTVRPGGRHPRPRP